MKPDRILILLFSGVCKIFILSFLFSPLSCINNPTRSSEYSKYPEKRIISYAKRLRIETSKGYSQVKILNPWQGADNIVQTWYIVPEGTFVSPDIDKSSVIRVPVKKIVCMSTTHLAMISVLGESESVAGFSGTGFLYNKSLAEKGKNGTIDEVGYDDNLNKELILKIEPDLVMVYGIGSESAGYVGKLKGLGFPVLYNADYLEADPLGKAEWIKLFGALYCKESLADSIFRATENRYNQIKSYISSLSVSKPKVLLGLPFNDTWYISPGNSYISNLINDAGGNYLWSETESMYSMPVAPESVYIKALTADYWLNTGSAETKDEIVAVDSRLGEIPCFKDGKLYNNTKRINETGGNDYWESGTLNPDIILKDVASILHPGIFPGWELYYYRKLN